METLIKIGVAVGFVAHYDAVGGYERGLDIEETLIEEVGGTHGAVSWSLDTNRHGL